jgi:hypothetical protein
MSDRIPMSEVQAAAEAVEAAQKMIGKYIMINPKSMDKTMKEYIQRNKLDTNYVGHIAGMDGWMYLIRWIDESNNIIEERTPKNLIENTNNFILLDATHLQEDKKQRLYEGEKPMNISSRQGISSEFQPKIDAKTPELDELMSNMHLFAMQRPRKSRTSVGGKKSRKNRKLYKKSCKSRKAHKKFCKSRKLRKSRNVRKTRRR